MCKVPLSSHALPEKSCRICQKRLFGARTNGIAHLRTTLATEDATFYEIKIFFVSSKGSNINV
jgi:hypothetical protein